MEMSLRSLRISYVSLFFFVVSVRFLLIYSSSFVLPIGVHPLDEKYFDSVVINCKDGSKSLTRDRINDNFCDCADGTDEPGTSACPNGKFYCKNLGSMPQFLFSSRVNDHICDCCDGSDEYDGSIICPNTCVMGGNVAYKTINTISDLGTIDTKELKNSLSAEDSVQKLNGLKVVISLQVILIIIVATFCLFYRRVRSKRRHSR